MYYKTLQSFLKTSSQNRKPIFGSPWTPIREPYMSPHIILTYPDMKVAINRHTPKGIPLIWVPLNHKP